jgi:hypothetical protein
MLDFLEGVEVYTSYRYALALVLSGLTIYWLITSLGSLRSLREFMAELNARVNEERFFNDVRRSLEPERDLSNLPPLNAKPGRIVKLALLSACLRLISFRTFRRVWFELLGCLVLAPLCVYAYWLVFSARV